MGKQLTITKGQFKYQQSPQGQPFVGSGTTHLEWQDDMYYVIPSDSGRPYISSPWWFPEEKKEIRFFRHPLGRYKHKDLVLKDAFTVTHEGVEIFHLDDPQWCAEVMRRMLLPENTILGDSGKAGSLLDALLRYPDISQDLLNAYPEYSLNNLIKNPLNELDGHNK